MGFAAIFALIEPALKFGLDVVKIIQERKDAGDIRLRDLPCWEEWNTKVIEPDFSLLLQRFNDVHDVKVK